MEPSFMNSPIPGPSSINSQLCTKSFKVTHTFLGIHNTHMQHEHSMHMFSHCKLIRVEYIQMSEMSTLTLVYYIRSI